MILLLVDQFTAPVFQLLGDVISTLRLLPRVHSNLSEELTCLTTTGHLSNRTSGVVIDALSEFPQHFDGGV